MCLHLVCWGLLSFWGDGSSVLSALPVDTVACDRSGAIAEWLILMTWSVKFDLLLVSEATYPRLVSLRQTFFKLKGRICWIPSDRRSSSNDVIEKKIFELKETPQLLGGLYRFVELTCTCSKTGKNRLCFL